MSRDAETRSVSDADLVRYLDGEVDATERQRLTAHLAGDLVAAARLATLVARSREFSGWLAALDPEDHQVARAGVAMRTHLSSLADRQRARNVDVSEKPGVDAGQVGWIPRMLERLNVRRSLRAGAPLVRAAAVVLIVAGAAFALPASRAWLAGAIENAAALLGITSPAAPAPPSSDGGPDFMHAFDATAPTFALEIAATGGGSVVLRRTAAAQVRVQVFEGPDVRLTVLPDGLRIEGTVARATSVQIELPITVKRLRWTGAASSDTALDLPEDHAWSRIIRVQ